MSAPVPSYLSSFLWMQQARGTEQFAQRFAGEWLLWEPGHWQAPARQGSTLSFSGPSPTSPRGGDALCFHLGISDGRTLSLGREPSNHIVVNDGTVSRHHVELTGSSGAWLVKPKPGRALTVAGVAAGDDGRVLIAGQVLMLGGAQFSFHDTASLLRRIAQT